MPGSTDVRAAGFPYLMLVMGVVFLAFGAVELLAALGRVPQSVWGTPTSLQTGSAFGLGSGMFAAGAFVLWRRSEIAKTGFAWPILRAGVGVTNAPRRWLGVLFGLFSSALFLIAGGVIATSTLEYCGRGTGRYCTFSLTPAPTIAFLGTATILLGFALALAGVLVMLRIYAQQNAGNPAYFQEGRSPFALPSSPDDDRS